jgi:nucleotide-binding universal stress UspA family protein
MSASTILVATDFSDTSRFAVDYATTQAKMSGAKVLIVHALSGPSPEQGEGMLHSSVDPEDRETAERQLEAIVSGMEGVHSEHRLVSGEPAKEIIRLAKDEGVELIVMGTHGRTGLIRALMGSVAEQVVRNATCPVVTVKVPKALA